MFDSVFYIAAKNNQKQMFHTYSSRFHYEFLIHQHRLLHSIANTNILDRSNKGGFSNTFPNLLPNWAHLIHNAHQAYTKRRRNKTIHVQWPFFLNAVSLAFSPIKDNLVESINVIQFQSHVTPSLPFIYDTVLQRLVLSTVAHDQLMQMNGVWVLVIETRKKEVTHIHVPLHPQSPSIA